MPGGLESDPGDVHVAERQQDEGSKHPIPYPVLTLPNEMVSEIFVRFLPPYPECPPWKGSLSPSLLTQICRKWREIALSTPELWRAMAFILSSPQRYPHFGPRFAIPQLDTSRFQSWLDRSGACPLSLQIISYLYGDRRVSQILDTALPHRGRWEHLKFHYGDASSLLRVDGPMPRHRHLDVDVDELESDPVPIFHDAPLLSTVVLTEGVTMALVLPWAQLTKVVLREVYPSTCSIVLQHTPNLVHCEIPSLFDGLDDPVEPDVHLPYLESLIFGDDSETVTVYHATFVVPALSRLQIPERFLGLDCIESLRCFLLKSGCQLREVRITGSFEVDRHEYYAAFPSIPSICFDEVETSK
ncbi:hypothetical protein C8R46DRAFT_288077 [Mycena filopes]|nr:hypothetical protein C8R46DRAFT_288077 [Mycena filopes]